MKITQEERYKQLFENVNDGVYIVNVKGDFTAVNSAAQQLTGYSPDEMLAMNFAHLVVPEQLAVVRAKIAEKMDQDISSIYEVDIVRKDGSLVPVEISSRAIYTDGKPVEILGIARDISERRNIEKQKEIFFSLVTHELKNPITSISIYTDLLAQNKKVQQDLKASKHVKAIQSQIGIVLERIQDFLQISQMRLGQFKIEKQLVDINQLVAVVLSDFQTTLPTRKFKQSGQVKQSILIDKGRIAQVLTNLISNAIKYSAEDKPVKVSLEQKEKKVVIGIVDQGIGIAKSEQKQVFELFYRTLTSQKGPTNGHGIGLYICKEIVHAHGGKIWVESNADKGSTFYFTLPIQTD